MNLLFAFLILASSPKQPQVYHYNGKELVKLHRIEMPNVGRTTFTFFVHSPYELRDAYIDSSEAHVCLPDLSTRKEFKLEGRWYTITWETRLSVGSSGHFIVLRSYRHKEYKEKFFVEVEGTKKMEKPQGVN